MLVIAIASVVARTSHAASYVFTNIADSSGIFAPSTPLVSGIGNGFLSINNFGVVAFSSQLDNGGNGVFRGSGVAITPIALSNDPVFSGVYGGSINDSGNVAFVGNLDSGGSGIFTGSGGATTPVALTSDGFTGFGAPRMNNAGRIAFIGGVAPGNLGLFLRGGGPAARVALESEPIFSSLADFSINSSGTVAFFAALESGSTGVFTGNGGAITTITLGSFPGGTPSINDAGTVAFGLDSTSTVATRILTGNGGGVSTYVSNAGPYNSFGVYPSINSSGKVAFLAGLDVVDFVVRDGLFTGPDPVADKVIIMNEPLFGSTLVAFDGANTQSPGNIDGNDQGQVAFHYKLADGRQGIAVATPVPEPSVATFLFVAVVSLPLFGRWRIQQRSTSRQPASA